MVKLENKPNSNPIKAKTKPIKAKTNPNKPDFKRHLFLQRFTTSMEVAIISRIWYLSMIKDLAVNSILDLKCDRLNMVPEVLIFFSRLDAARIQRKYLLIIRLPDSGNGEGDRFWPIY